MAPHNMNTPISASSSPNVEKPTKKTFAGSMSMGKIKMIPGLVPIKTKKYDGPVAVMTKNYDGPMHDDDDDDGNDDDRSNSNNGNSNNNNGSAPRSRSASAPTLEQLAGVEWDSKNNGYKQKQATATPQSTTTTSSTRRTRGENKIDRKKRHRKQRSCDLLEATFRDGEMHDKIPRVKSSPSVDALGRASANNANAKAVPPPPRRRTQGLQQGREPQRSAQEPRRSASAGHLEEMAQMQAVLDSHNHAAQQHQTRSQRQGQGHQNNQRSSKHNPPPAKSSSTSTSHSNSKDHITRGDHQQHHQQQHQTEKYKSSRTKYVKRNSAPHTRSLDHQASTSTSNKHHSQVQKDEETHHVSSSQKQQQQHTPRSHSHYYDGKDSASQHVSSSSQNKPHNRSRPHRSKSKDSVSVSHDVSSSSLKSQSQRRRPRAKSSDMIGTINDDVNMTPSPPCIPFQRTDSPMPSREKLNRDNGHSLSQEATMFMSKSSSLHVSTDGREMQIPATTATDPMMEDDDDIIPFPQVMTSKSRTKGLHTTPTNTNTHTHNSGESSKNNANKSEKKNRSTNKASTTNNDPYLSKDSEGKSISINKTTTKRGESRQRSPHPAESRQRSPHPVRGFNDPSVKQQQPDAQIKKSSNKPCGKKKSSSSMQESGKSYDEAPHSPSKAKHHSMNTNSRPATPATPRPSVDKQQPSPHDRAPTTPPSLNSFFQSKKSPPGKGPADSLADSSSSETTSSSSSGSDATVETVHTLDSFDDRKARTAEELHHLIEMMQQEFGRLRSAKVAAEMRAETLETDLASSQQERDAELVKHNEEMERWKRIAHSEKVRLEASQLKSEQLERDNAKLKTEWSKAIKDKGEVENKCLDLEGENRRLKKLLKRSSRSNKERSRSREMPYEDVSATDEGYIGTVRTVNSNGNMHHVVNVPLNDTSSRDGTESIRRGSIGSCASAATTSKLVGSSKWESGSTSSSRYRTPPSSPPPSRDATMESWAYLDEKLPSSSAAKQHRPHPQSAHVRTSHRNNMAHRNTNNNNDRSHSIQHAPRAPASWHGGKKSVRGILKMPVIVPPLDSSGVNTDNTRTGSFPNISVGPPSRTRSHMMPSNIKMNSNSINMFRDSALREEGGGGNVRMNSNSSSSGRSSISTLRDSALREEGGGVEVNLDFHNLAGSLRASTKSLDGMVVLMEELMMGDDVDDGMDVSTRSGPI